MCACVFWLQWLEKRKFSDKVSKILVVSFRHPGLRHCFAILPSIDQTVAVFLSKKVIALLFECDIRHDTHVNVGDNVNIIGDFDDRGCCRVLNDKNFIVVEPDTLLSGTSVVSSIHCMRRSFFNVC
jgi:DNA replication factor Dna2